MKLSTIILLLLFSISISLSAQSYQLKIIVYADSLSNKDSIFIAGNSPMLGEWSPNTIMLERINDTTFSKQFEVIENDQLIFKFTRGTWGKEALNNDLSTPKDNRLQVKSDTTVTYTVKFWKDKHSVPIKSHITGNAEYFRNFPVKGLSSRDIVVLLPRSYYKEKNKKYPVLYVNDGQNAFDPATANFGLDWRIDETVDSLTKAGVIKEIIVVAINSSRERYREYSYDSLGVLYCDFLTRQLKPFIDKKFRTLSDRTNTAVLGSSMGGLISFILLWEYSDVFSKAACMSPAFKIEVLDYVKKVEEDKDFRKDIFAYIDNGGFGLETLLQPGIDDMLSVLEKKGFKQNHEFVWYRDDAAEHNETAWALRVYKPLELFFAK